MLDVLVNGLLEQSFPRDDFEVIIVDSCYAERRPHMGVFPLPNNFFHLELPDKYDYYDASYANNFGLRLATGELIVFLTDNIWPEKNFLARHWQIYTNFPGYSMTGYVDRYDLPPLRESLEWETCWRSVYQYTFNETYAAHFFQTNEPYYRERKGGARGAAVPSSPYFELPGDFFYAGLNESMPLAVLKEINGFNQDLDGGYGCADIELGMRANLAGWKFLNYPESINFKLGQRANSAKIPGKFKKDIRTPDEQRAIAQRVISDIRAGASVKIENGAWS